MDISDIKKLKVGSFVDWYETIDNRRTGFRLGYAITRLNYKRGLVWGKPANDHQYWDHNSTLLKLSQIEISPTLPQYTKTITDGDETNI